MIVSFKTQVSWPGDREYEDTAESLIFVEMLECAKQGKSKYYLCAGDGNPLSTLTEVFQQTFADSADAKGVVFMATEFSYLPKSECSENIDYVFVEDKDEAIEKAKCQLKYRYDFVACESDQSHLSKAMHQFMRSLATKK